MGEVPTDDAALREGKIRRQLTRKSESLKAYLLFTLLGYRFHREPLSSIVLDTAEDDKGDRGAFTLEDGEDVVFAEGELTLARRNLDDRIGGVEVVGLRLRRKRVLNTTETHEYGWSGCG
jgi:hypothetical protein